MDIFHSRLCATLKEVYLKPIKNHSQKVQWIPEPFQGGVGGQLWMGENFPARTDELYYELKDGGILPIGVNKIDFSEGLQTSLKILYNELVFSTDNMLQGIRDHQLEENCRNILNLLITNIKQKIRNFSCLYFLNCIDGRSFDIPSENISFIEKEDQKYLDSLIQHDSKLSRIDINQGKLSETGLNLENSDFTYAIISRDKSSFDLAKNNATSKLRKLSSILHSNYVFENNRAPAICSGRQRTLLFQLFNYNGRDDFTLSTGVPSNFPAYCKNQINLTDKDINRIQTFFSQFNELEQTKKNRLEVCLYQYSLAILNQPDIAFIHYSIALDALFGERDKNKESIVKGILSLNIDGINKNAATSLYLLRCSLIHGSTRSIHEWSEYRKYKKEHNREPYNDLQKVIAFAIMHWPTL